LIDREAGLPYGAERGAVAVAADDQPVEPVHPVLQAGQGEVGGPDVLDEQKLAAGPQYPPQLPEGPGLIVDSAQDQGRDRHVEAVIVEREILGRRAQDTGGRPVLANRVLADPALQGAAT